MTQDQRQREAAHNAAVTSLKNELNLAVKLLRQVKTARETAERESDLIESARAAFQHATTSLGRVPQLDPADMQAVQQLMDEFRATLASLDE